MIVAVRAPPVCCDASEFVMAGGGCSPSAYEAALDALSSLISGRTRADGSNKGDGFDVMFDYLKVI